MDIGIDCLKIPAYGTIGTDMQTLCDHKMAIRINIGFVTNLQFSVNKNPAGV